jgi:prepilin-type N-terminal cleavage/methylation domain-containing protein
MSKINKYSVLNSLKTKDSQLKTPKAFTLVELIVVIVILAILATIAFLSFSSQSVSARDSTRLSDITNITK